MKTVVLIRHAKSSWNNMEWTDLDRPLDSRGLLDAEAMASIVSTKIDMPQAIFSSPAIRALTTAKIFANAMKYSENKIIINSGIYEQGVKFIKNLLCSPDNSINNIMLFGHNPAITSLVSYFTGDYIDELPTCGIACVDFFCNNWRDLMNRNGSLRFLITPKQLGDAIA